MYVKAWQNQGLEMRHWQIVHPFYKMRLGERLSFLNKELEDYKEE